eukprot:6208689-Amphidinium_carterae.3
MALKHASTPSNQGHSTQYRATLTIEDSNWTIAMRKINAISSIDKNLLRCIKGTIHYKVKLEPNVEYNERGQIKLNPVQIQPGQGAYAVQYYHGAQVDDLSINHNVLG